MISDDTEVHESSSNEHMAWMLQAMEMAEEALAASEVPVGCVFVRGGRVIARARNRTNELRNVFFSYPCGDPIH